VDEPVRAAFAQEPGVWAEAARETGKGKWRLDLVLANQQQMAACGIAPARIETTQHCVSCTPELFFSYRRDGGDTGRQMGFIMLS